MSYTKLANFFIVPQRIILSIMGFLALVNAYTMRVCISVAITEMVIRRNHSKHDVLVCKHHEDITNFTEVKMHLNSGNSYKWSEGLQGMMLSSFFWGYVITHIPGGLIADKCGGKWILNLSILLSAIASFLTPLAVVYSGPIALIILRIIMGCAQGTLFPALSCLLANWIPQEERATLGSFVFGGGQIGGLLGIGLSGLIIDHFKSWELVFYFWGALGVLWFIFFTFLCYNDPISHPFIKESEKEFLFIKMGVLERQKNPPIPWLAISTSLPVMAIVAGQIGHDWGAYTLIVDLPKYMADVLQISVKSNGLFSSIPYLFMWLTSIASGFFSDWMINKNIMNITASRKFWTILAAIGPAIFLVAASYAGCNKTIVIIFFTVCMGLMGPFYAGMKLNPLDLSPNYAGTLMAIANGIGSITGILVPIFIGLVTPDSTLAQWRLVFWIGFVVLTLSAIIYGIWGSGEVQPWNDPSENEISELTKRYEKTENYISTVNKKIG